MSKDNTPFTNLVKVILAVTLGPLVLLLLLCGLCEGAKKGYKRGKDRRCTYR